MWSLHICKNLKGFIIVTEKKTTTSGVIRLIHKYYSGIYRIWLVYWVLYTVSTVFLVIVLISRFRNSVDYNRSGDRLLTQYTRYQVSYHGYYMLDYYWGLWILESTPRCQPIIAVLSLQRTSTTFKVRTLGRYKTEYVERDKKLTKRKNRKSVSCWRHHSFHELHWIHIERSFNILEWYWHPWECKHQSPNFTLNRTLVTWTPTTDFRFHSRQNALWEGNWN